MPDETVARVVVTLSLDRVFDYRIPPPLLGQVALGAKVLVPFGPSRRDGYVIGLAATSAHPQLRDVEAVVGERPLFTPKLITLAEWLADYYCCAREQALLALLPAVVREGRASTPTRRMVRLADGVDAADALAGLRKNSPRQAEVIKALATCHECALSTLTRDAGIGSAAIGALAKRGVVTLWEETEERNPFASMEILPDAPRALTAEQRTALATIVESAAHPQRDVVLLFGVTGSGKTEVYLQAIAACRERGEEAIVLVPEIALTPQTMQRFCSRFGSQVSVLHSHLSEGERFDEWTRINEGRVSIVVGARSAVFAPFRKLGLIVVDEEHEPSYKQDRAPRYHARDVAVMRGHLENCTVVLGSATPSLESWHNVTRGKYRVCHLTQRVNAALGMPVMEVVDMAAEAERLGQPQVLSERLRFCISEALAAGEQVMLFLNRRGYATHLQCLVCGYVSTCEDCTMRHTYHRARGHLVCHLCGDVLRAPDHCPQCGDANIRYGGLGTEKIEAVVQMYFPHARVLRMDSDTMTRKSAYQDALRDFRGGKVDILVGTQMIAKGHDFGHVTVVGLIHADRALHLPDLRAGERTFQLIVQMAGRAGRGELPGRVIVQTYTPYHEAVQAAVQLDVAGFYEQELASRAPQFPPCTHLILLIFRGENEATVAAAAAELADALRPHLPPDALLTPASPCFLPRKKRLFRYQLQIYSARVVTVSRLLKRLLRTWKPPPDVTVSVDVDAMSLM